MAAPQMDIHELGEKMLSLASQYRFVADQLSIDAYKQLKAGVIDRVSYDQTRENVVKIFDKIVEIHRAVADLTAGAIEADVKMIDGVIQQVKDAAGRIAKTRKIVNVTLEAVTAIGVILIACTTPTPATVLAAVKETKTLADTITANT